MIKIEENYKVETLDFDFDIGDSLGHIGGVSGILKYLFIILYSLYTVICYSLQKLYQSLF